MNTHYEAIVVGLGAMGSAVFYQLAQLGVRVLGLDQYAPPHELGSTHGETRITRLAVGEGPAYIPLVRRTHEIWRALEDISGETLLTLTGGLIVGPQAGTTHFHGTNDFVQRTIDLAQAYNLAYQPYTATELGHQYPMLKLKGHEHAVYEPTAGVVRPERAVRIQLDQAQVQGAAIHTGEKVLAYSDNGDSVSVTTTKGQYGADKLILSTGPWMKDLLPPAVQKPFAVYRQVFYWFEAEDLGIFRSDCFPYVIWIGDTQSDFYTLFPTPSEGTQAVKMVTEQYVTTTHPDGVEREVQPDEIAYMAEHFIQNRVRGLKANCVQASVCLYTVTPDEHFVIDWHPQSERVLVVSPCSGHGFKHSAAIGEAVAQLVVDGESKIDLGSFGFGRF